jgi:transketolase
MGEKFRAFGFRVIDIDGHDYEQLESAFHETIFNQIGKPTAIIAKTIKGKGISYMEDQLEWHYKSPNDEQLQIALEELQ